MCRVLLSKHEFPVTQLQMLSGDTTGPNIETVETRRQVVCHESHPYEASQRVNEIELQGFQEIYSWRSY